MIVRKIIAIAVLLPFMIAPGMAQGVPSEGNAHIYQGGPKTGAPHNNKQPKRSKAEQATDGKSTGSKYHRYNVHGYRGGPNSNVPHTMHEPPSK